MRDYRPFPMSYGAWRTMKKTDPEVLERASALYVGGMPVNEIVKSAGEGRISKSTIYRELDERGIARQQARHQTSK